MSPSDWIALLSGISTLATALISLLTLRTLDQQRKDTYRPRIIITNTQIYGYKEIDNIGPPILWSESPAEDETQKKILKQFLNIPINNIGAGPAIEFTYSWDFELERFIDTMNDIAHKNLIDFRIDRFDTNVVIKNKSGAKLLFPNNGLIEGAVKYILPHAGHGNFIQLPAIFSYLISYYIYISTEEIKTISDWNPVDNSLFKIDLKLKYKDISGNSYENKINLAFNFVSYNSNPGELKESLYGNLSIL